VFESRRLRQRPVEPVVSGRGGEAVIALGNDHPRRRR
jgi:hypothetical protein